MSGLKKTAAFCAAAVLIMSTSVQAGVLESYNHLLNSAGVETKSSGTTVKTSGYVNSGPGATQAAETVTAYSMVETYYKDYGVYEQNLENTYFVYTTVQNGGITDQAVQIDFPADLSCKMKKDGIEMSYTSGQVITDKGSYVINFEGELDDGSKCKTTFRFRIQNKLPQPETTAAPTAPTTSYYSGLYSGSSFSNPYAGGMTYEQAAGIASQAEETSVAETTAEMIEETTEAEQESVSMEIMGEDGTIDEEVLSSLNGDGIGVMVPETFLDANGLAQVYDETSGVYVQTLLNEVSFQSNVPNGMITNGGVVLNTMDDLQFQVFRDGEEISYTAGEQLFTAGSYTVFVTQETTLFLSCYAGRQEPVFHFRIVDPNTAVYDLDWINAPVGGEILSVFDANGTSVSHTSGQVQLTTDGSYLLTFAIPSGETVTELKRDTVSPRFYMTNEKGKTSITYVNSADVAVCELYEGSELVSSTSAPVYEVTDPGKYTLIVYDAAGNSSMGNFEVEFRLNLGAVAAILIVVAIAAAGVYFVLTINKRMKIR